MCSEVRGCAVAVQAAHVEEVAYVRAVDVTGPVVDVAALLGLAPYPPSARRCAARVVGDAAAPLVLLGASATHRSIEHVRLQALPALVAGLTTAAGVTALFVEAGRIWITLDARQLRTHP